MMSPLTRGPRGRLGRLRKELELLNRSAVKSLDEGLEETLTLHRLGVFPILGRSLKTTNCLESIMSLIAQRNGQGGPLAQQRPEAALGGHGAPRHRASAEPDPGLPASAGLEGRHPLYARPSG